MRLHERIIHIENPQASGVTPAPGGGRIAVEGGTANAVIDLANPGPPRRGGHDPLAPQVLTRLVVTGRLRTGHTRDFHDLAEPIIIREQDDKYPGSIYAEGRCRACIAHPFLVRSDDETITVLEHEPGCPVMGGLLREAGVTR